MLTSNETTAAEIMRTDPPTASPSESLRDAARRIVEQHVGALPVVDNDGRCIGILSATDVIEFVDGHSAGHDQSSTSFSRYTDHDSQRWEYLILHDFADDELLATSRVEDVMNRRVVFAHPWSEVRDVARTMSRTMLHYIPVVDEDDILVGMITAFHFVRLVAGDRTAVATP